MFRAKGAFLYGGYPRAGGRRFFFRLACPFSNRIAHIWLRAEVGIMQHFATQ